MISELCKRVVVQWGGLPCERYGVYMLALSIVHKIAASDCFVRTCWVAIPDCWGHFGIS